MTLFPPGPKFLTFLVPKYLQKWPLKFQEWHFGPWSFKNDISAPLTSEFSFNTPILSEFHPYSIQLEYLSSSSLELYTRSVSATFLEFWLPTTLRNSRNTLSPSSEFNSPFNLFQMFTNSEKDCMKMNINQYTKSCKPLLSYTRIEIYILFMGFWMVI